MRESRSIMADLAASGLSADQLALVMELSAAVATEARPIRDEQADRRRERDRERKRNVRRIPQTSADSADTLSLSPSPTPLSTIPNPVTPYSPPNQADKSPTEEPFDRFWQAYPNRTAKRVAKAAFDRALKRGSLEAMMAGIAAAKRSDKWRNGFVPNPATWLNGDCWLDGQIPGPDPPKPLTPEAVAWRHDRYRETGEWRPEWGERPTAAA